MLSGDLNANTRRKVAPFFPLYPRDEHEEGDLEKHTPLQNELKMMKVHFIVFSSIYSKSDRRKL